MQVGQKTYVYQNVQTIYKPFYNGRGYACAINHAWEHKGPPLKKGYKSLHNTYLCLTSMRRRVGGCVCVCVCVYMCTSIDVQC